MSILCDIEDERSEEETCFIPWSEIGLLLRFLRGGFGSLTKSHEAKKEWLNASLAAGRNSVVI